MWDWVLLHWPSLQVLRELGPGLGTSVLSVLCPVWDWVLLHWLSLQVLCELGPGLGTYGAGCPVWDWVLSHWLSLQVLCELGTGHFWCCLSCVGLGAVALAVPASSP